MKACTLLYIASLCCCPAQAQQRVAPRDPMQAPAAAAAQPRGGALAPLEAPAVSVRQLLVVDGQRYVVHGGRRRAVGEWLGDARIESIEDSAVVVRRGGQLQRLPLFAGVTKTPVAASPLVAPDTAPDTARDTARDTTAATPAVATRTALAPAPRTASPSRAGPSP